jgi:hypothetical protein
MGARRSRPVAVADLAKQSAALVAVFKKGRVIPVDDAALSFLKLVGCESLFEYMDQYEVAGGLATYSYSKPYLEERELLTLLAAITALRGSPRRMSARQVAAQLPKKSPAMVAGWRGHAHGSLYARFVAKVVANYHRAGPISLTADWSPISPTSPHSPK